MEWSEDMVAVFLGDNHALAAATLLVHLHATAPTFITVDVSNIAVWGVLEQLLDSQEIISLFQSPETRYSVFYQELLALTSLYYIFAIFGRLRFCGIFRP